MKTPMPFKQRNRSTRIWSNSKQIAHSDIVTLAHLNFAIREENQLPNWPGITNTVGLSVLLGGCQKPGEGGTATIVGKVYAKDYDGLGTLISEFEKSDEDVYITGGGTSYMTTETSQLLMALSVFVFKKGEYTVFVYSDCDMSSGIRPSAKQSASLLMERTLCSTIECQK